MNGSNLNKRRNKFVSLLLVIAMVLPSIPIFTVTASAASGNWNDGGNYNTTVATQLATSFTINTAAQLAGFAVSVNSGKNYSGCTVTLGADIDMGAHYWEPIGNSLSNSFAGTFNGAGHKISNLTYTTITNADTYGLFGYTSGATIKNLKFTANMTLSSLAGSSNNYICIGGLVGFSTSTNIYDCEFISATSFSAHTATKNLYVGGIVGYSNANNIVSCIVNPTISSSSSASGFETYTGGIAAKGEGTKILNCSAKKVYSSGTTASANYVIGGIVGYLTAGGTVDSCQTLDTIEVASGTMSDLKAGGIAGAVDSGSYIRNCNVSSSPVTISGTFGTGYYGGVAGVIASSTILDCYTAATLNASLTKMGSIAGKATSATMHNIIYTNAGSCAKVVGEDSSNNVYDLIQAASGVCTTTIIIPTNELTVSGNASDFLNAGYARDTFSAGAKSIPYMISWTGTSTPLLSDWVRPGNYDVNIAHATPGNITVNSAAELAGIAAASRLYGKDYSAYTITLGADINLSAYPWVGFPMGTFDGGNHIISGLNIKTGWLNYGLFSTATEVKNLTVLGTLNAATNVGMREINVGGIVGKATNMTSCTSNITVTFASNITWNDTSKPLFVGGMLGSLNNNGQMDKCYASGSVNVAARNYSNIGGLAAFMNSATITRCSSQTTTIFSNTTSGTRAGGLIAVAEGTATILNSSSRGELKAQGSQTAVWSQGGFLSRGVGGTISNCYTTVNVIGPPTAGANVGGFTGANDGATTYNNCLSGGTVTSTMSGSYGGFFGLTNNEAIINNSYWLQSTAFSDKTKWIGTASGTPTINNLTMLTATQLANDEVIPSENTVGTASYAGSNIITALNTVKGTITNADSWLDDGAAPKLVPSRPVVTFLVNGSESSAPIQSVASLYSNTTKVVDMTGSFGVYTANIADGTYNVYVDGADTGVDITVTAGVGSATVNYNTVTYTVANAGTASGSAISATASGSAITSGACVLSGKPVVITAVGAGATNYTYAWTGTTGGGIASAGALSISSLSSAVNATCTVTGTSAATVNINLDGTASASPATSGVALYSGATKTADMTSSTAGTYTANVLYGTYDVYVNGADTGVNLVVSSVASSVTVNYYTVTYTVANDGKASSSTIAATASGSAITSGAYVLSGKPVIITVTGAGATSYAYAWTGTTGGGIASAGALSISSLNSAVNANCTVTGIKASTVTINLDGTASASPATSGVALYLGTTKTTDMAISAAGIYTAIVGNGTYNVYVNGADTGVDLAVSSGVGSVAVDYHTVAYTVTNAGSASGSIISATAGGSAITNGAYVLSGKEVVITASGAGAKAYIYSWTNIPTGGVSDGSKLTVSQISTAINVSCSVLGTEGSSVLVKLDGAGSVSPVTSGVYLKDAYGTQYTLSATGSITGLYTVSVADGTYDVYINGIDTGKNLIVLANNGSVAVDYYTVNFAVANAGKASGSTISATASGSAITSGAYVLSGKPVIITASGAGANSYAYAWGGTTGGGITNAGALSISSLSSAVNATCTVTGISAATVTIKLDGSASSSPVNSGVALYSVATKTADMTSSGAGIYSASVADGTYNVYVNGADTGVDLAVSSGVGSATVIYYTVAYTVANAGTASGSTISATAGGGAITSGTYVLSSKPVVITAVGAGANSYAYAWTGAIGGGTTNAGALSISSLSSAVNAICTATGATSNTSGGSVGGSSGGSSGGSVGGVVGETVESNSTNIKIAVSVSANTTSADKVFELSVPISSTTNEDGQKAVTVEINEADTVDKIKEYTKSYLNSSLNIDLGQVDAFSAMFTLQTIKDLNDSKTKLNLSSQDTTYSFVASAINSEDVMEKFNSNVKESDVTVKITANKATSSETEAVKKIVERNGYESVINPVSFSIEATNTKSTYEITKLSKYAERYIKVPSDVNIADITTAVVIEDDGSIRHVPTKITNIDGINYVEINSLSNSVYALIKNSETFSDTTGHWAANEIHDMASRTAVSGVRENVFEPNRSITRAEFATLVVKGLGMELDEYSGIFGDVASTNWYSRYIETAYKYGIINGNGNGKFNPNAQITREQAFAMISRAISITDLTYVLTDSEADEILAKLSDNKNISSYFSRNVAVCIKTNLINGRNTGEIAPKDRITRAEAMVILRRLLVNSNLI